MPSSADPVTGSALLASALATDASGSAAAPVPWVLPALPALVYLALASVPLAIADLRWRRLPNALVLPAYPVAGLGVVWAALSGSGAPWIALLALAAAAAGLLALWTVGAIGMGDVKLGALLASVLGLSGWGALLVAFTVAFVAGGIVSAAVLARASADARARRIPFGPFLLGGFWLGAGVSLAATPVG